LAPGQVRHIALVAETAADARDVMVGDGKGPEEASGILQVHPKDFRPIYNSSLRRLTWPNGAIASIYNATEPEQLRGPQHGAAWCDELAKWRYAEETWDQLEFGLRLGNPRVCITTTPKPIKLLKAIIADPATVVTGGSTYENHNNLAQNFLDRVVRKYEGTRVGRQELAAEILEDVPNALWTRDLIEQGRIKNRQLVPNMQRVVVAIEDPNAEAHGGNARLRAAGVEVVTGVEAEAAHELNAPWLFSVSGAERPFVTLKLALSIDGAIAPGGGAQRWLTGPLARRQVHKLRANADAVAVGIGTVLTDDPQLTVRAGRRPRVAPVRVVFDSGARLPLASKLVKSAKKVPVWVAASTAATSPSFDAQAALERRGVVVRRAASLGEQLAALRSAGVRHLFVEGGAGIAGALMNAGFVDRLVIFRAPVLLGAGARPAFGTVAPSVADATRWSVVEHRVFGDDEMTAYRPSSR